MAGDVALLEAFQRGEIPPTLRVYQWASPALTYGVNQQLPPRLVDACNALGIPMLRRPTGGKAVLHGHDLTVGLVFRYVALTPSPSPTQWESRAESALTPSPSSTGRERGAAHHWSAEASASASGGSSASALQTPPRPRAGEGDTGGEGDTNTRPYPRQVYQCLAPALIEAFAQVGIPAVQGSARARPAQPRRRRRLLRHARDCRPRACRDRGQTDGLRAAGARRVRADAGVHPAAPPKCPSSGCSGIRTLRRRR
jgi:hypothetical protein